MNTEQQAALLEEIAAVMRARREDGFREFEWTLEPRKRSPRYAVCGPDWEDLLRQVADPAYRVRRRPTITIAGVEVPIEAKEMAYQLLHQGPAPHVVARALLDIIESNEQVRHG